MGLPETHYERFEQFAFECYMQELKVRAIASIAVFRAEVPTVGVLYMPDDYIRYTKIGICKDGRIRTLTLDDTLCSKEPNVCGSLEDTPSDDAYSIVPHWYNGLFYGGLASPTLYMMGGGINRDGYYKVDGRKIILDQVFAGSEIVVEYQSTGVVDGNVLVPALFVDAMRYYMAWKYYEYMPGGDNKAQLEYQKFADYFTEGKMQQDMPTISELLDMLYSTSGYNLR
jgi:hypothetical protein